MDRYRAPSQASVDRKGNTFKDGSLASLNKQNQIQNEIDDLIQIGILDAIYEYDPKLDFSCVPIISRDQIIRQTRRQTTGLIWNSIRSSTISKLVHDDRSCAFVEIHRIPSEWSRYDIDLLLLKIHQKKYLNGLALRDEFVRVLQIILKRDFNEETKYPYEFKDVDFTRNIIQLVFNNRQEPDITLIISLILLVEFNVPCIEFFPETYPLLCYHNEFNEYFQFNTDVNRTRLTPYNSIKFLFDYSVTESILCDYLLQQTTPLSSMLTNFLKLRKEWIKYIPRAAKYAAETVRTQAHTEKQRQSTCSINSIRSATSNNNTTNPNSKKYSSCFFLRYILVRLEVMQTKVSLSTEIEVAFDFLFSISLLRLLFLTVCSKYKQFGSELDNDIAYAIEKALQIFSDALENNYLEHPFFKNTNILPDSFLTYDIGVKIGIKKLIKEMQRDWKRNIRREEKKK